MKDYRSAAVCFAGFMRVLSLFWEALAQVRDGLRAAAASSLREEGVMLASIAAVLAVLWGVSAAGAAVV